VSDDDDLTAGIFVPCRPKELAAWETTVAMKYRDLTVEQLARTLLNCHAVSEERRLREKEFDWLPDWVPNWWRS
jgi:hypothetical protein